MPVTINASTSSGVVITPDYSGNIQLQYNGVSAPVFSVYRSGNQTISGDTWTKVQFNAESFDTADCFDSTTNYRFTPNVAGYYNFIGVVQAGSSTTYVGSSIYKNGGSVALTWSNNESAMTAVTNGIIYMNGSTDFVEIYALITGGTTKTIGQGIPNTYFHGYLVRGA